MAKNEPLQYCVRCGCMVPGNKLGEGQHMKPDGQGGMVAAERVSGELDETEARVLAAIKADASELDVDEVAEALRERLGDSLAESLGRKLLGQQSPGPVTQ